MQFYCNLKNEANSDTAQVVEVKFIARNDGLQYLSSRTRLKHEKQAIPCTNTMYKTVTIY